MPPLLDKYMNDTLKNSPLAYYRMREGTGSTMTDYSVNVNNGTYTSVNWVAKTGPATSAYTSASGKDVPLWGSYYQIADYTQTPPVVTIQPYNAFFDGAAGRATATLGTINTGAASSVTLEMWVKWDGVLAGANGTFEALANFGGATGLLLGFLKNGASDYRLGLSVRNAGDLWGLSNANTLAAFPKDTYVHIVYVIVNNNVQTSKLYINGVQYTMTQQIGTSTTTDSVTSAFALAYDGTASFFGGSIGEVAIYNGEPYNATAVRNRFHQGAYGGEYQEIATMPGIESRIELQLDSLAPLVLNDKDATGPGNRTRTLNQYYIKDIGGLDDPDIRANEENAFYRDGTSPLITRMGGRTLTFDGYIEGANIQSMRQMQSRLKSAVSGGSLGGVYGPAAGLFEGLIVFRNVWNNGFDFGINARKNTSLQMREAQTSYMARRDFLLTMRASYPYFESIGSRTEILQMGATLPIHNKGNMVAMPVVNVWGPFTDARVVIGSTTIILQGSVLASTFITVDSKNRTCSDWTKFSTLGDFPFIVNALFTDSALPYASFVSVATGTAGVTRVEITWKHTMI